MPVANLGVPTVFGGKPYPRRDDRRPAARTPVLPWWSAGVTATTSDQSPPQDRSASSDDVPFGSLRYRVDTGKMVWSDELFQIFGFTPGDVVPTLALMASHQHPQDRGRWERDVDRILADGRPFSRWHRIIDARRRVRTLQTAMDAVVGPDDTVELRGIVSDLTERLRRDRDEELATAVARSTQSRAVIDQAKGVLMATMDIDEAQAFDLLRWHSSYTNIKLRELAAMLLAGLADPTTAGLLPRQRLTAILTALIGPRQPALPAPARAAWTSTPEPPTDRPTTVSARIPIALMPGTLVRAVGAAAVSITIADCQSDDWPLVYVNAAFEKLTGYPAADILGRNCRFLQGAGTDPAQSAAIRAALRAGEEVRTVLKNYRKDGTAFWNELHLSAVRDDDGLITHYIGYQSDVSERVEREQQIEHLAYHDASTSLPNRAAALRHLERAIRCGDALTVLHIQLTGHRGTGGPADADTIRSVLTTASQRLSAALSEGTFLARLDDDEFVAVIPGRPDHPGRSAAAAFDKPISSGAGEVPVAVTIGQAWYPGDVTQPHALIDAARRGTAAAPQAQS